MLRNNLELFNVKKRTDKFHYTKSKKFSVIPTDETCDANPLDRATYARETLKESRVYAWRECSLESKR